MLRPHGLASALILALSLLACGGGSSGSGTTTTSTGSGGHGGSGGGGNVMISSLRVEPLDPVVSAPFGAAQTLTFKAFGKPSSGGAEIAVDAAFDFDQLQLGGFDGSATFTTPGKKGGKGTVTATFGGQQATTSLTINVSDDVGMDGINATDIPGLVMGTSDGSLAPSWSYPEDGVVIPPNLYGVAFQWQAAAGADAYVLSLSCAGGTARIAGTQTSVAIDPATWDALVTMCGPGLVTATITGASTSAHTAGASATRTFALSQKPLSGAMYYWSSKGDYAPVMPGEDQTSPRGYFRFDFNTVAPGAAATSFLGFNRAGNNCVGCHSVARDGTLFATSFETDTHWAAMSVASQDNPVQWVQGGPSDPTALGNFNTFTPDGAFLLVSGASMLRAFDLSAATATQVASFATPFPASHIAVSPKDTTTVLYVEDLSGAGGTRVGRGRIVRVTWDPSAKAFSNRTVLLEDPAASVYYPAISPDGVWVLYNRALSGESLSNPGAEVWAMRLDGSGSPIQLARANQASMQSNSWPRWAPFGADDGQGHARYYFTFSSVRPYAALTGVPQLWLATFDPATAGGDASTPAIWLPMQSTALHNHAAQWTEVFVQPPPN